MVRAVSFLSRRVLRCSRNAADARSEINAPRMGRWDPS